MQRLNSAEMLNRFNDGMKLLDKRQHGVFAIVELLGADQNLGGVLAWNDNDTILIGDYDVIGVHLDSIAVDRDIHTAKAVMTHRGRRH